MSSNQIKQSQLIHNIVENIIDGETRYAFLLGAGASVTSGIKLANDLAKIWFNELKTSHSEAYKLIADKVETGQSFSKLYSEIYFARFGKCQNDGYAAIEKIITAPSIKPSIGYTLLADILLKTSHNLILTTNFDRLAETELLTIFNHYAKVIYHESLLEFFQLNDEDPTILKVHNDVYFHPKSSVDSTDKLLCNWQNKISDILNTYNLIVLGYGGNEKEGLAKFLKEKAENTQNRIFWCTIGDNSPPDNNFRHVKIDGFDDFMLTLHKKLPEGKKTNFNDITNGIKRNAQNKIQKLNDELKRLEQQKLYAEFLKEFTAKSWWEYQIKIDHTEDINEKEALYKAGLEKFPNSAELMGNYALFFEQERFNYEKAEEHYLIALKIDPDHANNTGLYAVFLNTHHKDYKQAEIYYLKALEIDPNHANNNGNYAIFLDQIRFNYEKAEEHYLIALELEPDNAHFNGDYAAFLQIRRKNYNQAEKYYLKALKIEPDHLINNGNFAVFLQIHRKDYNQAEIYYLRALKIDPDDEYNNGHYAGLLLATSRKKEAIPYLEIAEKTSNQDNLQLTFLFFRLAHFREDYEKSKSAILELLKKGVRSVGWNFDAHIDRAEKDGYTKVDELREIAKDINTEAPTIK